MADIDKLHNAINSLQENAERIAAIGKLSEDLLRSQTQLSAGIRQMTDALGQMDSYQFKIKEEIESIKKIESSNGRDIIDLQNRLASLDSSLKASMKAIDSEVASMNKNVLQVDSNLKTRLDDLEIHISVANVATVDAVKTNHKHMILCTIILIAVVVIVHFL